MMFFTISFLLSVALAKHEEYAGWKSYYVQPQSQEQLQFLVSTKNDLELDFLGQPSAKRETIVLVKPQYQEYFIELLQEWDITYRVHIEDIVKALRYDDVAIKSRLRELKTYNGENLPYNNYQRLAVYDAYLEDVARRYPSTVTLVNPANSFEGRPIKYLKISTTNFQDLNKPVIVIDGGIHAREWISPPTVIWAVHKLVENVTEPDLLERFDWILLPIVNPDGYEYSHTDNRFWRKTRSTDSSSLSTDCPGVDGNRNYDFLWNTVGTSSNPCADTFPGSGPFSEIETRVVRDILYENLSRIALYLTMHSFGSMILYPWGHNGSLSNNSMDLYAVGVEMMEAVQKVAHPDFPTYVVGNSALVVGYGTSGAADDYAHHIGVPLAYTYELPGLSSDLQGFNLDSSYIKQVCQETWEGIIVGARRAGDLFISSP